MLKRMNYLILVVLFVVAGCANPGGNTTMQPPSPTEVKILVTGFTSIALNAQKRPLTLEDLSAIEAAVLATRDMILLTIQQDPTQNPTGVDSSGVDLIKNLDPLYRDLIVDVMQIAFARIRPFIDQANPDVIMATEYLNKTVEGLLVSVNRARTRLS